MESLTTHGETYPVAASYNTAGQLDQLTYPDGSVIERTYMVRGELETITRNTEPVLAREYDDRGRLIEQTFGNGIVEEFVWNDDDACQSIDGPAGLFEYSYDNNQSRTTEAITGALSVASWATGVNGFDDDDRLVFRNQGTGTLEEVWELFPVGDWDEFTQNTVVQTRTHGPAHEIESITTTPTTVNIAHDPKKGNVTVDDLGQVLTWDFDNQLASVDTDADNDPDVEYEYDALGRRVARTENATTEVYVCRRVDVIADYPAEATSAEPLHTYAMAQRIDDRIAMFPAIPESSSSSSLSSSCGGESIPAHYYHADAVTSIRALTDEYGDSAELYQYESYGQPSILSPTLTSRITSFVGNRYLFTAREWDDVTQLYNFRARWLSATMGRFITCDPEGHEDGPNLYAAYFIPDSIDPLDHSFWGYVPVVGTAIHCFTTPDGARASNYSQPRPTDAECKADKLLAVTECENRIKAQATRFIAAWAGLTFPADGAKATLATVIAGVAAKYGTSGVAGGFATGGALMIDACVDAASVIDGVSDIQNPYKAITAHVFNCP